MFAFVEMRRLVGAVLLLLLLLMHHVQLPAVVAIYFFAIVVALEVEAAFLFTVEIITEHQAVMPVVTHKPWSAVVCLIL